MDTVASPSLPGQTFSPSWVPVGQSDSVLLHRAVNLLEEREALYRVPDGQLAFTTTFAGGEVSRLLSLSSATTPARARRAVVVARTRALSNAHIPPRSVLSECSVDIWKGANHVQLHKRLPCRGAGGGKRGRVKGLSRGARGRLMGCLASIRTDERSPLPISEWISLPEGNGLPLFVTRTFPDVVPSAGACRELDDRYFKRLGRRFSTAGVVWRRELQVRKSGVNVGKWVPHLHEQVWGVPRCFPCKAERGEWVEFVRGTDVDGVEVWDTHLAFLDGSGVKQWRWRGRLFGGQDSFDAWLARAWFELVGSGDVDHFQHGTDVQFPRDGNAVRAYVGKAQRYMSKDELQAAASSPYFAGSRCWGVRWGDNIPWGTRETVAISLAVFYALRRMGAHHVCKMRKHKSRFLCQRLFVSHPLEWLRLVEYFSCEGDAPG